jgi:protein SCO1/2
MSSRRLACAALALVFAAAAARVWADAPDEGVAFAPRMGATLPADARFRDDDGNAVRLGQLVAARPTLVVLGYYGCSNLCSVLLNGLAAGLDGTGLRAGDDFDVVVVSIDPLDTPAAARAKKLATLDRMTPARDPRGWHLLSGGDADRVARALGAQYRRDVAAAQYAHAAGVTLVARGGCVTGVLYGVAFAPSTLRARVRQAAAWRCGRDDPTAAAVAGETAPGHWLLCFRYDPHTGRYSVAAMDAVRLAALLPLLALGGWMFFTRRRARR